jgi:hypothetical protein
MLWGSVHVLATTCQGIDPTCINRVEFRRIVTTLAVHRRTLVGLASPEYMACSSRSSFVLVSVWGFFPATPVVPEGTGFITAFDPTFQAISSRPRNVAMTGRKLGS